MLSITEEVFNSKIDAALKRVRTVLDNNKRPQRPAEVHHTYDDKFLLAEFLTNTAVASLFNALEHLGLDAKVASKLREWAVQRSVTLRLTAEEECHYLREETREEEDPTTHVTTINVGPTIKHKVLRKVTEHFWKFTFKYTLLAFRGNDTDSPAVLNEQSGEIELKTPTKTTPHKESVVRAPIDLNITWLLNNSENDETTKFRIDRDSSSCHTPRRNTEVTQALDQMQEITNFTTHLSNYFANTLFAVHSGHTYDLTILNKLDTLFVPVIALFEEIPSTSLGSHRSRSGEKSPRRHREKSSRRSHKEPKDSVSERSSSPSLSVQNMLSTLPNQGSGVVPFGYVNSFLAEQSRSIDEKLAELKTTFPDDGRVITQRTATVVLITRHISALATALINGLDYVELMLRKQLIAAIGKEVTSVDFHNYMIFHNRKMFRKEYQPRAFSYAVRRPDHAPEGVVSVEAELADGHPSEPIQSIVHSGIAERPMKFSLNAATRVAFSGERHLHGWVSHQFSGQPGPSLSLIGRARQFSSFIMMVGRIASADVFEPKYAMIIKNKDEIKIPLLLETIPTPKEFKDAIASLSPEQQRFAKAYRSMQLSSTLFGVLIIQIKPQLEKLLKIPRGSLTKEIALTQDLQNLFMEYQIPADLVTYDGDPDDSVEEKIRAVKSHVEQMQAVISKSKDKELEEARERQRYRVAESDISSSSASSSLNFLQRFGGARGGGGVGRGAVALNRRDEMNPQSLATPPSTSTSPPDSGATAPQLPKQELEPSKSEGIDYTSIPPKLEKRYEEFDEDSALRPTIISAGKIWNKSYCKTSILSPSTQETVTKEGQRKEKNHAFDLLDALTRSGALVIEDASLHVIIAATHCFDKTLLNTVIQDNINPIEKVERSELIIASTLHNVAPADLIKPAQLEQITISSAKLLGAGVPSE